ncbi:MAG: hypothetical protein GY696_27745 [Gammaproteobacteria bacterium]|nr:hypothetical protein [Gammaproteobacteria bacterium]
MQKDGMLIDEKIIKNTEIRNALFHLTLEQQLEHLDDNFDNSCGSFFGQVDGVKNRKKPTNADEYTYLASAIKTLFTKIDGMVDIKNMFKLTLFSHEILSLYPDSVKDKVLDKINGMKNVEDMNNMMKDLDYLKWQIAPGSSSSNNSHSSNSFKKSQHQQPKNPKNTFHVIDKSNLPKCKVNGCSDNHHIWHCPVYRSLSPTDRYETMMAQSLCRVCLGTGHLWKECPKEFSCKVKKCGGDHQLLHDAHLLRIVWTAIPGGAPEVYVGQVNNFGLRCTVASIALNMTANMFEYLHPGAPEIIWRKKYVDDVVTGGTNIPHTVNIEEGIAKISSKGRFKFKQAIRSFNDVEPQKILGVNWIIRTDKLTVKCEINVQDKIKGARIATDVDLDILDLPAEITVGSYGGWPSYGLISVIIIQLKLIMRLLATLSVSKAGWDQLVSEEASAEFRRTCSNLAGARKVEFAKCTL